MRERNEMINATCMLATIVLLASTAPAAAYLDPGAGGMVLQAVVAIVAVVLGYLIMLKDKCRTFIRTLNSRLLRSFGRR
jgi:hypothetical protein